MTGKRQKRRGWQQRVRFTAKKRAAYVRACFRTRSALEVFYGGGLDLTKDRAIEKAVGRHADGTGMWLTIGLRDLRFEFKAERSVLSAARRVKKAVRGTRCMLHSSKKV